MTTRTATCPQCGRPADGASFCAGCGAFLDWEGTDPTEATPVQAVPARPVGVPAGESQTRQTAGLELRLDHDALDVMPGEAATVDLTVRNTGTRVEDVRLAAPGPAWVRIEPPALQVYPGQAATAVIRVEPPRDPATAAGVVDLVVSAASTLHRSTASAAGLRLSVAVFRHFEASLAPTATRGGRRTRHRLLLVNGGNAALRATIATEGGDDRLRFRHPGAVELAPGGRGDVPLDVETERRWLGRPETMTFTVVADPGDGEPPVRLAASRTRLPLLPAWAMAAAGLAVAGAVATVVATSAGSGSPGTPPATGPVATGGTPTAPPSTPAAEPSVSPEATAPPGTAPETTPPPARTAQRAVPETVLDLVRAAPLALWTDSAGEPLEFGVEAEAPDGYVTVREQWPLADGRTAAAVLETVPDSLQDRNVVQGVYRLPRPVADGDRFRTDVGFVAEPTGSVDFELLAGDGNGLDSTVRIRSFAGPAERTVSFDADLSRFEGATAITLRVTATNPGSVDDRAMWLDPRIVNAAG